MAYLLDANAFITAKRLHYGMDFCPGYWRWLEKAHTEGIVYSIDRVGDELTGSEDELAEWARTQGTAFFRPLEQSVRQPLATIAGWTLDQPRFRPAAKDDFLQTADYFLVAAALAGGHTVVTHERHAPASVKSVKIPDVCLAHEVPCVTPFEMLRRERARLVLPGGPATSPVESTLFD